LRRDALREQRGPQHVPVVEYPYQANGNTLYGSRYKFDTD